MITVAHRDGAPVRFGVLLGFCVCGLAATAEPLSWEAATAQALAGSPQVKAAEAGLAQAQAAARAAAAWPALRVGVSPLYSDERSLDVEATLEQPLLEPTLAPLARAARCAADVAVLELAEARQAVLADTQLAYVRLAAANRVAAAQTADVELARALRDAAAKARAVGERAGVDLLRADLELSLAQQRQAEALSDAEQRHGELVALLGLAPGTRLSIVDALELQGAPTADTLAATAATRPRLRAASVGIDRQRQLEAAARAQRQPQLSVGAFREDREHGVRLTLNLPWFDRGRARAEADAAAAGAQQAQQALAGAQREVARELAQAQAAYEAAVSRRARYRAEVLTQATRLAELAQRGYQLGELGMSEVLDARRRCAEVRRGAIALDLQVAEALINLSRAAGGLSLTARPTPNLVEVPHVAP